MSESSDMKARIIIEKKEMSSVSYKGSQNKIR